MFYKTSGELTVRKLKKLTVVLTFFFISTSAATVLACSMTSGSTSYYMSGGKADPYGSHNRETIFEPVTSRRQLYDKLQNMLIICNNKALFFFGDNPDYNVWRSQSARCQNQMKSHYQEWVGLMCH